MSFHVVDKALQKSLDGGDLEHKKDELRQVVHLCGNKPLGLPEQKKLSVVNLLLMAFWSLQGTKTYHRLHFETSSISLGK